MGAWLWVGIYCVMWLFGNGYCELPFCSHDACYYGGLCRWDGRCCPPTWLNSLLLRLKHLETDPSWSKASLGYLCLLKAGLHPLANDTLICHAILCCNCECTKLFDSCHCKGIKTTVAALISLYQPHSAQLKACWGGDDIMQKKVVRRLPAFGRWSREE